MASQSAKGKKNKSSHQTIHHGLGDFLGNTTTFEESVGTSSAPRTEREILTHSGKQKRPEDLFSGPRAATDTTWLSAAAKVRYQCLRRVLGSSCDGQANSSRRLLLLLLIGRRARTHDTVSRVVHGVNSHARCCPLSFSYYFVVLLYKCRLISCYYWLMLLCYYWLASRGRQGGACEPAMATEGKPAGYGYGYG